MKCPACQSLLPAADAASCPGCGLSLAAVDRLLGIAPTLTAPLADMAGVFSDAARRRIEQLSHRIQQRLPQARIAVVTTDRAPAELPLSVYAFWLFNRSGICSPVERGGANHLVMLVIQIAEAAGKAGRAACMIGYGLEEHLAGEVLTDSLSAATAELARGEWEAASLVFFNRIEPRLIEACRLANEAVRQAEDGEEKAAAPEAEASEETAAVQAST